MNTEQRHRPPPPGSGRRALRARKALEQDYERLHQTTLNALSGKLRGQGVHFDRSDLDAFYNQAWHALYAKLAAGDAVENTGAFLTQVAYFRAIDEYRKLHPGKRAEVEDVADLGGLEVDVDAQLDDAQQLREFLEGLKSRLDEREARAAALCYVHGYTRPEAAKIIGVSPSRMEKLMDKVSKVVRSLTAEIEAGAWCESQKSLMTAYAVNVLDPDGERYKLAVVHLNDCPGCRAYVRRLRGIAGIVPPIMLPFGLLGVPAAAVVGQAASGGAVSAPPVGAATGGAGATGGSSGAGGGVSGGSGGGSTGGVSGGSGGGGGAGGVPTPPKSVLVVGAGVAVAVAVAIAALALGGGDDDPPSATDTGPAGASAPGAPSGAGGGSSSSAAADAADRAAARAKERREARAAAARAKARRKRAAARREREQQAAAAAAAAAAGPPPPADPAATPSGGPAPTPSADPAPTPPQAAPPPSTPAPSRTPTTTQQEAPPPVETDGEQEFGLEPDPEFEP